MGCRRPREVAPLPRRGGRRCSRVTAPAGREGERGRERVCSCPLAECRLPASVARLRDRLLQPAGRRQSEGRAMRGDELHEGAGLNNGPEPHCALYACTQAPGGPSPSPACSDSLHLGNANANANTMCARTLLYPPPPSASGAPAGWRGHALTMSVLRLQAAVSLSL